MINKAFAAFAIAFMTLCHVEGLERGDVVRRNEDGDICRVWDTQRRNGKVKISRTERNAGINNGSTWFDENLFTKVEAGDILTNDEGLEYEVTQVEPFQLSYFMTHEQFRANFGQDASTLSEKQPVKRKAATCSWLCRCGPAKAENTWVAQIEPLQLTTQLDNMYDLGNFQFKSKGESGRRRRLLSSKKAN